MSAVEVPNISNNKIFGLLFLICAQLCLSINVIIGKYLSSEQLTPIVILVLRFGLGTIILFSYLLITKQFKTTIDSVYQLSNVDKKSLFTQSLFSGFLYNILILTGVKLTSATIAGIFISAEPALILILSYFILKEKIKSHQLLSILIAVLGILSLNLTKIRMEGFNSNLIGDLIVFLAILPEALYTIVAKRFPVKLTPVQFAFMVNLINTSLFMASLLLFTNDYILLANLMMFDWLLVISILPISGFMFFLLWNIGLKYSSAQQAGLVTAVVPVGVCILAVLFLHEHVHIYEAVGVSLVILAIIIGSKEESNLNNKNEIINNKITDRIIA